MSSGTGQEAPSQAKDTVYLASFDCLGFECIIDLTKIDKQRMWAALKGKEAPGQLGMGVPLHAMMLRARANPQRSPEIWTFTSELDRETLISYSKHEPQALADAIRRCGKAIFTSAKEKKVIV